MNKTEFAVAVDALIARAITDRTERIAAIKELTESCYGPHDPAQLERLTDYILREELTDPDNHKTLHNEYPIMSEIQLSRRRFGRRGEESSNMSGETSLSKADNVATDGLDYRYPNRRKRTIGELIYVDELAIKRNRSRNAQYRKDTSPSVIIAYNLRDTGGELAAEFTASAGLAQRWRDSLSAV
ncbi:hypothetical protein [Paenibacillus sp. SI8]|uniref:hypothetical protein n=1 Tax=unclassified Paenibacillus TaxID=185978 RepID=UPI0034669683